MLTVVRSQLREDTRVRRMVVDEARRGCSSRRVGGRSRRRKSSRQIQLGMGGERDACFSNRRAVLVLSGDSKSGRTRRERGHVVLQCGCDTAWTSSQHHVCNSIGASKGLVESDGISLGRCDTVGIVRRWRGRGRNECSESKDTAAEQQKAPFSCVLGLVLYPTQYILYSINL
jgi:hypothetical protein